MADPDDMVRYGGTVKRWVLDSLRKEAEENGCSLNSIISTALEARQLHYMQNKPVMESSIQTNVKAMKPLDIMRELSYTYIPHPLELINWPMVAEDINKELKKRVTGWHGEPKDIMNELQKINQERING